MSGPESSRRSGRVRQWFTSRRQSPQERGRQALQPALPDISQPTELERHRGIVAAEVLKLVNLYDEEVSRRIGFGGKSIRKELFPRRPLSTHDEINTDGLDPVLHPYLHPEGFVYSADNSADEMVESYRINYHGGSFNPKIESRRPDGRIQIHVFAKQTLDDYGTVQITKTWENGSSRRITTFYPNFMSKGPDHFLRVDTSGGIRAIYNNIDSEGNVTLLDGQPIQIGFLEGKYSAADYSITPHRGEPIYGTETANGVLHFTDKYGRPVSIHRRTNLYSEIRALVHDTSAPGLPEKSLLLSLKQLLAKRHK